MTIMKKTTLYTTAIAAACITALTFAGVATAENIIVKNGSTVAWTGDETTVDRVELNDAKTELAVKAANGDALWSGAVNGLTITFGDAPTPPTSNRPVADLLDIVFNADGTATDVSAAGKEVKVFGTPAVAYSQTYSRYVATFTQQMGGAVQMSYRVDYDDDQAYKDKLADGHTMEAVFMADYDGTFPDVEAKPFATHQGGGTGLMVCKTNNGKDGKNELTFLPNTTDGGWRWATSGVYPEAKKFYHVVGVYNKDEQKAYVYVNGELKNTVDAKGDFKFATGTARWWCIGGDADNANGGNAWNGSVAIARVYDKPLTQEEVSQLYADVEAEETKPVADMMDVVFNADGSAADVSPFAKEVGKFGAPTMTYNRDFDRYVATFANDMAAANENVKDYYRVDYASDQTFKDKLSDGHTLEAIYAANYDEDVFPNVEAKPFASHQAGGTGLMVCRVANGKDGKNELTFLPNTTDGGWRWATSGVYPEKMVYYHVVGVYNKDEQKAYVYVNGELKNTVDAKGDFKFAPDAAQWFAIGADSNSGGPGNAWKGDVTATRIYDAPLTAEQVATLFRASGVTAK